MFGIILLKDDIDCLITVETVCTAGNVSLTLQSFLPNSSLKKKIVTSSSFTRLASRYNA